MNLDGLLITKYILELKKYLPAKINKLKQISDQEFLFQLRSNGENHQLFISTQPKSYRFYLTKQKFNTSFEPSTFLMVLRKHLSQSILKNIVQLNGDRALYFEFETLNDLKDKVTYRLYLELFGKYTNLILVDQSMKIIDTLKRTTLNVSRSIYPGLKFKEEYNKEKTTILDRQDLPLDYYNGVSKLILQSNYNTKQIYEALLHSDTIYFYPTKNKFHFMPLFDEITQTYSLFEAMDIVYYEDTNKKRIDELSGNIHRYIKKELDKSTKKLVKLHQSLEEAKLLEQYQYYGDLLYTYAHTLPQHTTVVEVIDFEGNNVVIPLEEKYDIKENAKRYYKKYRKSKTALEMIQTQIDKTNDSIIIYQNIIDQLTYITLEDALEIAEEFNLNHKHSIKTKANKQPNFLMLEIDNVKIYVGKNNIQNDYITNKISKKHYLWFHVKDMHGSHVVVNQSEVNEKILRLCASLAAYYSKARYSSSIPVNYCLLKQLKATRGNQLGMVYLGNYKTIFIDIDEQELLNTINQYQK